MKFTYGCIFWTSFLMKFALTFFYSLVSILNEYA